MNPILSLSPKTMPTAPWSGHHCFYLLMMWKVALAFLYEICFPNIQFNKNPCGNPLEQSELRPSICQANFWQCPDAAMLIGNASTGDLMADGPWRWGCFNWPILDPVWDRWTPTGQRRPRKQVQEKLDSIHLAFCCNPASTHHLVISVSSIFLPSQVWDMPKWLKAYAFSRIENGHTGPITKLEESSNLTPGFLHGVFLKKNFPDRSAILGTVP